MTNPDALAEAMKRANHRCEWIYYSGERCRNTMSLQGHHRTYIRNGREISSDLSIVCPAHHLLADFIRKGEIGIRNDIVFEHLFENVDRKLSWLNGNGQKFYERFNREFERYFSDVRQFGRDAARDYEWMMIVRCLCTHQDDLKSYTPELDALNEFLTWMQ